MRNLLVALALAASSSGAAACGGNGSTGSGPTSTLPACATPLPAPTGPTRLPPNFPIPHGVVVTASQQAGPTTVVRGYATKRIPELFDQWKAALNRPPYSVVKSEQEARDAEVNFSGEDTTGQVRLGAECEGQTSVQITARPL